MIPANINHGASIDIIQSIHIPAPKTHRRGLKPLRAPNIQMEKLLLPDGLSSLLLSLPSGRIFPSFSIHILNPEDFPPFPLLSTHPLQAEERVFPSPSIHILNPADFPPFPLPSTHPLQAEEEPVFPSPSRHETSTSSNSSESSVQKD